MIVFGDGIKLEFTYMGQFVGKENWIHPERAISTYEIIYVNSGEVFIEEDGEFHHLTEGDMLCLRPEVVHRGYRKTDNTGFFWLHFRADNYDRLGLYRHTFSDRHAPELFFKQLCHLAVSEKDHSLLECRLAAFLLETVGSLKQKNKLFEDACEYIRLNIAAFPTVTSVAEHFGYNEHYLSRLFVKNCGLSLKAYIDEKRNAYVKHLLLSTTLTVTEIAHMAGFSGYSSLSKFFKYKNHITPTEFRNSNYASHTNDH